MNSVIVVIVSKVATVENTSHFDDKHKLMSAVKSDEILNFNHLYLKIRLKCS